MKHHRCNCWPQLLISRIALSISWLLFSINSLAQVNQEWVKLYNGAANLVDNAAAIKIDSFGNIFVAGYTTTRICKNFSVSDFVTIKYNQQGDTIWTRGITGIPVGFSLCNAMALDKYGNIYVTGFTGSIPELTNEPQIFGYVTVKYNRKGEQQWVSYYDPEDVRNGIDEAQAITVDGAGNAYVTGKSEAPDGSTDAVTIKYNTAGQQSWINRFTSNDKNSRESGESIATDEFGNIYVLVTRHIDVQILDSICLIKYNSNGTVQWVRSHNGFCGGNKSLFIDRFGSAYITGTYKEHFIVAKYDKDGLLKWTKDEGVGSGRVITGNRSGQIWAAATSLPIAKYNSDGRRQWITRTPQNVRVTDIALDASGNVYLAGSNIVSSDNERDYVTWKYDRDGNVQWTQQYNGPLNGWDQSAAIAVDRSNNVFVTGVVQVRENTDVATLKYSQSPEQFGVCCFDNGFGPQAKCGSNITPLNCSKSGKDAFFAGSVSDCALIDTATLCGKTPSIVHIDATYLENERSIKVSWNRKESNPITGYYVQRSTDGISFKSIGFMPVSTSGNYIFTDPYPEIENYYKLVWFEKRGYESNKVLAVAMDKDQVQLIPNPATNKVKIIFKDIERSNSLLTITDNLGSIKFSQRITKGTRPELDISNLSAGVYFVRIEQNGKTYRGKVVKQ